MRPPEADDDGAVRILVVDGRIPTPDRDGGSLRLFNILTLLVDLGCRVSFAPNDPAAQPENMAPLGPYIEQLRAGGIRVFTAPRIQTLRQHLEDRGHGYEVVMLSGGITNAYAHIADVRRLAPRASLWFDTVDLTFVREYRRARLLGNRQALQYALDIKRLEVRAAAEADQTLVVSAEEAGVLKRAAPMAKVQVLPNIHHVSDRVAPFETRKGIIFIGAYQHAPNLDGLRWFLQEVFPLLRTALPDLGLTIIGADPPPEALALAQPGVHIAGHVRDLSPVYEACRLSIAPLRFGAGVKGKVLMSLGYGVPVVATPIAAEGSYLVDGQNVRIASTPADFAQAIVEVYTQAELWQTLSRGGRDTIAQHLSFGAARSRLRKMLAAVSARRRSIVLSLSKHPLVSAIIPVFNGERYLAAAIESVLAQDYQPLELIVVDDGSTDSTPAIIQKYPQARYVRQPNQGHGVAKNTGIAAARGEFIAFLDADDVWRPAKIRLQAAQLILNPALGYVTCHCRLVREPGTPWPAWVRPRYHDSPQPAYLPSALLARRSAFEKVGQFDPAFWHTNDTDWILRARDAGVESLMLADVLYERRVHADNQTNQTTAIMAESFRLLHGSVKRKRAAQTRSQTDA